MKSFDVKIAGDPYVFDGKGIELGGAPREAVAPGQLGAIIIPSVHLGLGHARDTTAGRYWYATGAITHKPGFLLPGFDRSAALATYARGTPLYPWSVAYEKGGLEDKAFLISPKKLYIFDPHVDTPGPTEVVDSDLATLSGDKRYTGSCFLWNSQWIFGFEDDQKVAAGFARVGPGSSSLLYDNASSATSASNTLGWSHTIGGGNNRLLIIGVSTRPASATVTSVTYGGVGMTKLIDIGVGAYSSIWYLKEAGIVAAGGAGAHNAVATTSGATAMVRGAASWSGAHQTTTFGTPVTSSGTSTTPL